MSHDPTDGNIEDLIRRVLGGDPHDREEAASKIFKIYYGRVSSYFGNRGVPSHEADDLTQDVFCGVFRRMDTFHGKLELEFNAWLFQIVHNRYANYVRGRRAAKRDAPEIPIEAGSGDRDAPFEIPDSREEPLRTMIRRQDRARLESALQSLPEKMRECCIQRYVHGLKYREIAARQGISIETVKAHLFQGRRRLSESLRGSARRGDQP